MALVGLIERGTVRRLLHSVAETKRDAVILLRRESQFAHVVFDKGACTSAQLGGFTGIDALQVIQEWSSGYFSVGRRTTQEGAQDYFHVLVVASNPKTRSALERWLAKHGFETSVLTNPDHTIQFVEMLEPDVVVVDCMQARYGTSCLDLRVLLRNTESSPPLVITLSEPGKQCGRPNQLCLTEPVDLSHLEDLLAQRWPGTRYDTVAAAAEFERTNFTNDVRQAMEHYEQENSPLPFTPKDIRNKRHLSPNTPFRSVRRQVAVAFLTATIGSILVWVLYYLVGH